MRRIVIGILLAAALPAAGLEESKAVGPERLADILKQYRSIEAISATFKQKKTFQDIKMELKSEGRFEISRPNKTVLWEVSVPSRLQVVMNEKELRLASDDSTQVLKLSEIGGDKASRSLGALVAWLELDASKLAGQYTINEITATRFRFTPKDKVASIFLELDMWLDKQGYLTRLVINEKSGDRLDIEFGPPKLDRAKK